MAMWQSSTDTPPSAKKLSSRCSNLTYLSSGLVVSLCRRDLISALVSAGCSHLAINIFDYLDSASLLACSLVCVDWQRLLLSSIYTTTKFRRRVRAAVFHGTPSISQILLSLDMARALVIDVALDDDFNIFALGLLAGRPHVMACSLFGLGKKRWVHRFSENFDPDQLSCIAAGQSLVALGSKDGRIHLYECNHQFKCLRLSAILAHHSGAIHNIIFEAQHIVSCSDDMTIGVIAILSNGSLLLSKLLHGHVSRIRALDVQNGRILSGSDDRSVKVWSLKANKPNSKESSSEKPFNTMTGHSGPVTGVQLSLPFALSAAGSAVRLWDVLQGTCLKLLQHEEDSPVTTMTWISTFKGVATVDSTGNLRCFDLYDLETSNHEIVVASSVTRLQQDETTESGSTSPSPPSSSASSSTSSSPSSSHASKAVQTSPSSSSSPKQKRNRSSQCPWPENTIFKLESIPHHFSAFSLSNTPLPTITVHCLDYVL